MGARERDTDGIYNFAYPKGVMVPVVAVHPFWNGVKIVFLSMFGISVLKTKNQK